MHWLFNTGEQGKIEFIAETEKKAWELIHERVAIKHKKSRKITEKIETKNNSRGLLSVEVTDFSELKQ